MSALRRRVRRLDQPPFPILECTAAYAPHVAASLWFGDRDSCGGIAAGERARQRDHPRRTKPRDNPKLSLTLVT